MNDPLAVRLGDRTRQRLDELRRGRSGPGGAVESLVEAAAGQVLELEVGEAADRADVVDLHDARVAEPGDRLGLAPEPRRGGRGEVGAGQDHLQGTAAVEGELVRQVDHPHPAAAQLAEDLVPRAPQLLERVAAEVRPRQRFTGVRRLVARRLAGRGPGPVAGGVEADATWVLAAGSNWAKTASTMSGVLRIAGAIRRSGSGSTPSLNW